MCAPESYAMLENKRRTKERQPVEKESPWGSLLRRSSREDPSRNLPPEDDTEAGYMGEQGAGHTRDLWSRLNFWSIFATTIFLLFAGGMALLVVQMWNPQDTGDIAGFEDKGAPKDLTLTLKNAGGAEVSFTEGEINRYLRDSCSMRQGGIFSLISHERGVALRIQDGYAELVIDRLLSTHLHQTTSVHLSFAREMRNGVPALRVDFRGGEPILGSLPCGGSIGKVNIPQRLMEMLRPALKTMLDCYPDFLRLVEQYGYYPEFTASRNGEEGRVRLIPYSSSPF